MAFQLKSPDFSHQAEIPTKYTCDGRDISPPLSWTEVPRGTKSLVLIVDDPDAPDPQAPRMTWVHWVVYNLPPETSFIDKGAANTGNLPKGAKQGINDWQNRYYGGPCPPVGCHRYFFKLYALDEILNNIENPTKLAVENAMKGHIIAKSEIIGTYERPH